MPFGYARGQPPQEWSIIVRSYWCPDCDAGPGSPCITHRGLPKTEPHVARIRDVNRCVRCSARMHAEWAHRLCDRCHVLLRLDPDDDGDG